MNKLNNNAVLVFLWKQLTGANVITTLERSECFEGVLLTLVPGTVVVATMVPGSREYYYYFY